MTRRRNSSADRTGSFGAENHRHCSRNLANSAAERNVPLSRSRGDNPLSFMVKPLVQADKHERVDLRLLAQPDTLIRVDSLGRVSHLLYSPSNNNHQIVVPF